MKQNARGAGPNWSVNLPILKPAYSFCGLVGILAVLFLLLTVFYSLSYEYYIFYHIVHIQNTAFMFFLSSALVIFSLKTIFSLKRAIWWVWGTQTPDFEAPEYNPIKPDEEMLSEARNKGFRWTFFGFLSAYFFPISGLYVDPFLETTYVTEYPNIPLLPDLLQYIAGLPLFSELGFVTELFTVIHPLQTVIIGFVLVPLTLGLWNFAYVFENMGVLGESVRQNPVQTASLYFASIGIGVIGTGISIFIAFMMASN